MLAPHAIPGKRPSGTRSPNLRSILDAQTATILEKLILLRTAAGEESERKSLRGIFGSYSMLTFGNRRHHTTGSFCYLEK